MASTTGVAPQSCNDSTDVGNVMDFQYDFHLNNGDNGNLYTATNNKDTTRTQSYTYDTLNRLMSAITTGTDCSVYVPGSTTQTKYWGEGFTYDAWGNLTGKATSMCSAETVPLPVNSALNNNLGLGGRGGAGSATNAITIPICT